MLHPENNWFVLLGDQKYGPYNYKTMINMIQTNQLMDYNYAWAAHLESWTPIHQLEEFSKDRFQLLLQKESDYLSSFIKRDKPRVDVHIPLLGHNSIRFFDGIVTSLSESGALCLLNTPLVQVSDLLKIHIKANDQSDVAFNIEAEVIRKNFSKERLNSKSGLYYAIRFNDIHSVGLNQIQKLVAA
ncbi:MAG: PilZ domain-containing protein [Pseudobdellovibrio sp.]